MPYETNARGHLRYIKFLCHNERMENEGLETPVRGGVHTALG